MVHSMTPGLWHTRNTVELSFLTTPNFTNLFKSIHPLPNIESILRAREERRIEITMTLTFLVGIVQV